MYGKVTGNEILENVKYALTQLFQDYVSVLQRNSAQGSFYSS